MSHTKILFLSFCTLNFLAGCGAKIQLDPTITNSEIGQIQVTLLKSPIVQEYTPLTIVESIDQEDSWLVNIIKANDKTKKAKFRIDKKSKMVERIID